MAQSKNKIKDAFHNQRHNAKKRSISFNFKYEDWLMWWETHLGPDWFLKRGCNSGQYVMARKEDKGAYEEGNIKCILCNLNSFERKHVRRRHKEPPP